jgi:excisionase family DNA binding protein
MTTDQRQRVPVERLAYSPGELAIALGVTRAHVHRLIRDGVIPSTLLGRRRLIHRDVVDRLLDADSEAGGDVA